MLLQKAIFAIVLHKEVEIPKNISLKKINLDVVGMTLSLGCAVHCAIFPLLVAFQPFWEDSIIYSEGFEISIIASSIIVGTGALGWGFLKHAKVLPLLMFLCGVGVIFAREHVEIPEALMMPVAGSVIAIAHYINHRYLHH